MYIRIIVNVTPINLTFPATRSFLITYRVGLHRVACSCRAQPRDVSNVIRTDASRCPDRTSPITWSGSVTSKTFVVGGARTRTQFSSTSF